MGQQEEQSVDEQLEQLEERAEKRRAENAKAEKAQRVIDLGAKEELAEEHGEDGIATVKVARYAPGFPTCAFVKRPESVVYKKYQDQVNKAQGKENAKALREAHEAFARACWIYPVEKDDRDRMLARFPGILNTIGHAAAKLAEGAAEEEGKG